MQKKVVESNKVICDYCQTYYPNKRCLWIHEYIHVEKDIDALTHCISELSNKSNYLPRAQRLLPVSSVRKLRCSNCEEDEYASTEKKGNSKIQRMTEMVDEVLYLTKKYPLKTFHSKLLENYPDPYTSRENKINDSSSAMKSAIIPISDKLMDSEESDDHQFSDESPQKENSKTFIFSQTKIENNSFKVTDYRPNCLRKKSASIDSTTDSAYYSSPNEDFLNQSFDSNPEKSSSDSDDYSSNLFSNFCNQSKGCCDSLIFSNIFPKSEFQSAKK